MWSVVVGPYLVCSLLPDSPGYVPVHILCASGVSNIASRSWAAAPCKGDAARGDEAATGADWADERRLGSAGSTR